MQVASRTAKFGKRQSVTPNGVANMAHLTPQQAYAQEEKTFGAVKGFTYPKSANRSSFKSGSRNHNAQEAVNNS